MKVAILSSGIPSQQYPLNGVFAFDQAKALAYAGIDVYFLSIDFRSIRKKRKVGFSTGEKDGVKWFNLSVPIGPINTLLRVALLLFTVPLYKKAFTKDNRPDIIHAHFGELGEMALILKKRLGIPYVLTEHSSAINKPLIPKRMKRSITKFYSQSDGLIAVSGALSEKIFIHTACRAIIIPNIVQSDIFLNIIKKNHKGFRLVTTSNLIPLKRTSLLITAVSELRNELTDIFLDIIGDGIIKEELQSMCNRLGTNDIVSFHGLLTRDKIADIYGASDCFILVSSSETFGVAYIEAIAAGLPVIGTKCGGPEDFVTKENGILVEVDNLNQIKDAIRFMYINHSSYDYKDLRKYIIENFSPEIVAKKIIDVYGEIVKKNNYNNYARH